MAQIRDRVTSDRVGFSRARAVGLVGAVLFLGGFGAYLAQSAPAYAYSDEQVHVGYVEVVRDGSLPTIDTAIPLDGDEALRQKVAKERQDHRREIYTANNPPFVYLAVAPLGKTGSWLGARSPDLFALRLLNVSGAMASVACTYLLGRELSGGDDVVGLAAAGLLAATIGVGIIAATGGLDGIALAATTGLTWALARSARLPSAAHFLSVGLWAAFAAAVRPMSAAYAAAAIVIGLLFAWRAAGWRGVPRLGARLAGPAILVTGWFYALNLYRYGDPTGSAALFDKLDRTVWFEPTLKLWGATFDHLFTDTTLELRGTAIMSPVPKDASINGVVFATAIVMVALFIVVRWRRRAHRLGQPSTVLLGAWLSAIVLSSMPVVLTMKHVSAGGNLHPRYLIPMVPVLACAAAFVSSRIGRWLPLLVVALVSTWHVSQIETAASIARRSGGVFLPSNRPPLVGPTIPLVSLAHASALLGAVALVAGLAALTVLDRHPSSGSGARTPSQPVPVEGTENRAL